MKHPSSPTSRRGFLRRIAPAALVLTSDPFGNRTRGATPSPVSIPSIRLGAPVFSPQDDPELFALAHKELGYRAAYAPNVQLGDRDRINAFVKAFQKQDIAIAEVGRWVNLMDPDPVKRKANLKTVTEGLALAEELGAGCCVDIGGSFNPDVWFGPHPDNLSAAAFDLAVENARAVIDAVRPQRAKFAYEMMGWCIPHDVDTYLRLIQSIDRPVFGVHLDPCNLVNSPERFYQNSALIQDCFDRLGPWIVSCHAKDLAWEVELNVHFVEVMPGTGSIDYPTFLACLAKHPAHPPLMIEHLADAVAYDQARRFIMKTGSAAGIDFG